MESQRSFLFIALMVVTYLLFTEYQKDNAPVVAQPAMTQTTNQVNTSDADSIPQSSSSAMPISTMVKASEQVISIDTDVLIVKIATRGGDIVEARLKDFDTEQGNGIPFTVMQNGNRKYVAQSGLIGAQGLDQVIPGRPVYQTSSKSYTQTGNTPLVVDLQYTAENGLNVTKRFTFTKSDYSVDVEYIINNTATTAATVQMYGQLKQSTVVESGSSLMPTYRGAAYSTTEDRYEKYDFGDIEEKRLNVTTAGGWVAMLEHYFVSAWVPSLTADNNIYSSYSANNEAVIGFKSPSVTIQPNSQATTSAIFYVGPKDQYKLDEIAPNLGLTIDYGFLFMISKPLFWLLLQIQSLVTNWGIAIIVITLVVKGAMYPLTKAQYTSMAKMRELAPKMAQLKERFGDDRQKMSQATMEMYKKEKVNPAGGCLPMIIQMPIFLALYWVFLESVELRHAPFFFWIEDLSTMDPYFILPVFMGVSMFVMQKMQPMTIQDPMQQKIMQYMPVAFSVFMAWFPSGLVLYWFVSNMISIVQMKIIFSGIEKAKLAKVKAKD
ncbi:MULTISPECIES: membrane protein insertase YidC [unclassified Colwellia]|jgi:YidC/Oxa1 family membrane protein insertase|uniref:membrane protein insertase YidC n=1 Tax=unclassified Colwellia TaxID=196834 RepID=UPI0015F456B5|nr:MULTISPECIES: membrane protein insertase YidC [unclassified Colwellia]MBA6231296.1 membrane protein insertase YidC [Colwellia sp. MB02u-7]MBA6238403.1 membrane protein insertase YidC [Colwellia sp. MB02u-11]MBA6255177.1 membrane protein insertase YidC [Colwellia sp. MB3u-28]MBA6260752.1 membrane protein insertase YidC [Colwellia sp. MB3u-41]MBA6299124.1 membrane protein insertase YidC [Colwellia sp. MB3u-22]